MNHINPNSTFFHRKQKEILKILDLSNSSHGFFFAENKNISQTEHLKGLKFFKVIPSQFCEIPFMVAEDSLDDVYIIFAFNHSNDKDSLLLKCELVGMGMKEGKFHKGFLEVAKKFPFETIFSLDR